MEFDAEWIQSLVARWLPEFYLHPDDRYFPCSAEFFLSHSELHGQRCPDGAAAVLAARGSLSGPALLELQDRHAVDHRRLWLELHPDARTGGPAHALHQVPVYCHAKAVVHHADPSRAEAVELTYITLFAYNGDYSVVPGLLSVGAHDGDIEHITVRVHPQSGELIGVWYNSHRSRDGEWLAGREVPKTKSGRPVAYIARHGHGNYPRTGTVWRHFGLGNDKCSAEGPVWRPGRVVLLPHVCLTRTAGVYARGDASGTRKRTLPCCPSRGCLLLVEEEGQGGDGDGRNEVEVVADDACEWLFFRGDWGQTPAAISQSWFHAAETPVSRSSFTRLCLHIWPETNSVLS